MSKVHWYVKCGRTIPIFESSCGLFYISKDTIIPNWDDYYSQTEESLRNRCFVEHNKTNSWLHFNSLSATTSFLYGKPCDIKTTIKVSQVLDDAEFKIVRYCANNSTSIYKIDENGDFYSDMFSRCLIGKGNEYQG